MRFIIALLLFTTIASAEENCESMMETMTHFRGTVRSAEAVAVANTEFDEVDLDPNFVVVIDAEDGRKLTLGIHSLARTFGSGKIAGREFLFDAEQMECNGQFRRLLTLQVHHGSPIVETFDGWLEVGHRYRAKVMHTKEGLALTRTLELPMHHDGGVSFTNADQFQNAQDAIVFDVAARRITRAAEWQWITLFDATIVDEHAAQCDLRSFTAPPSHMTNQLSQPFVVRQFRGRFLDSEGVFPNEEFVFELHGPDGLSVRLPIASDGSFEAKKLRPGRYCFQTSSPSFQGWSGTVIIDEHAPEENTIELTLKVGV